MDVVSPRSLEEALRVKADHPDAVPIQGGTDLMVELNFDRRRPEVLLNLNEVPELRGWSRENGTLRLGSGLTYTEVDGGRRSARRCRRSPRRRGRSGRRRSATAGRSAGTSGRPRLPETPCRRCSSRRRRSSSRRVRGVRTLPLARLPRRPEAERRRAGRADLGRPGRAFGRRRRRS